MDQQDQHAFVTSNDAFVFGRGITVAAPVVVAAGIYGGWKAIREAQEEGVREAKRVKREAAGLPALSPYKK